VAKGVTEAVQRLGRLSVNKSGTAPVAYALIHSEDGRYFAAELLQVSFKDVNILELNSRPEYRGTALERVISAMTRRTMGGRGRADGWLPRRLRK